MAEYDDLIKEFGTTTDKKAVAVTTPHADLIQEFGGGAVQATPPQSEPSYIPKPQTDEQILASQNRPSPSLPVSEYPVIRKGIKGYKEGTDLATEGYKDISQNKSFQGVGKVLLGHGEQVLNIVPVLPVIGEATDLITKATGNKEFADRAELVATSGLPILKAGKILAATRPSSRAIDFIAETIGKENIAPVLEQLKSNPRLTLMDVDPNVQIVAQGQAAKPGEPRNILDKFSKGRMATQKGAVIEAIDDTMGVPVSVKQKIDGLKANIKAVGAEINPIVANTKPVDLSYVLNHIESKAKPGVNSVITAGEPLPSTKVIEELESFKQYLTDGKSIRTDAKSLHSLQSSLRYRAEQLLDSQNPEQRQIGHALMQVRTKIVDAIDASSPQIQQADGSFKGSYRPALAKYRDENNINDAFNKGQLILKNRQARLEDHPEFWEDWKKNASKEEIAAAQEGARLAVAHQMGAFRFAAKKGTDVPEVDFNKEKLQLLFGKKEVEDMSKLLSDERKIKDTDTKLFQNSMTAMRQLGAEGTKVRESYKPSFSNLLPIALEAGAAYATGGNVLGAGMLTGYTYQGVRKIMTKIGQKLDKDTHVEIANLASATGQSKDELIKALQSYIPQGKLTMKQKLQLSLPTTP